MESDEIINLLAKDDFRTTYIERYLNKSEKLKTEKKTVSKDENCIIMPIKKLEEIYNNIKHHLEGKTILIFNIEMLNYIFCQNKNLNPKNITYVYDNSEREEFANIYNVNLKSIQDLNRDKFKYDIVVCFPPPNVYRKFFHLCTKVYHELLVFISPSIWILSNKNSYVKMKNSCYGKNMTINLYNGNPIYKITFLSPFADCYIKNIEGSVTVNNYLSKHEITSEYENIFFVKFYGNSKIFHSILYKIELMIEKFGSIGAYIYQSGHKPYYFGISKIRGHAYQNEDVLYKDDFYTFYPKDETIQTTMMDKAKYWIGFPFYKEAESFKSYLDSKIARFCLSIVKFNTHMNRGELNKVPMIPLIKIWDDDTLKEFFEFTEEEISFILKSL